MLVLTRRVGEKIVIESAICVTVVAIKGNQVRLGVTAPESVRVDRVEVHEQRSALGRPRGDTVMRTVQQGDRVQVHYVKRFQDGSVVCSRSRGAPPLELTIGTDHPRLPGLGVGLVGLALGTHVTLTVPADRAYGISDPSRIRRFVRTRFPKDEPLPIGKWVRIPNRQGQRRLVRILEARSNTVVVDTNHRWAGQAMELEVEVVGIRDPDAPTDLREP
jgi:carbon storage regulator CsrA